MTIVMRCNACNGVIATGEERPDKALFVEVMTSDDASRRRHYHREPPAGKTEACWNVVRAGLVAAEQSVRA